MKTMAWAPQVMALLNGALRPFCKEGVCRAFLPLASALTQRTIIEHVPPWCLSGLQGSFPQVKGHPVPAADEQRWVGVCLETEAWDTKHPVCAAMPWDRSFPGVSPGGLAARQACPFCTDGLAAGLQQTRLFCFWLKSLIGAL